jgi:hypothetical protein
MELRDRLINGYGDDMIVKNVCIADLLYELDGSIDFYGGDVDQWLIHCMWKKVAEEATPLLIWNMLRNGLQTPLNVVWNERYDTLKMGNGHHRLIAALLCGITHCDIYVTDDCDHSVTEGSFPHFKYDEHCIAGSPKFTSAAKAIDNALIEHLKCVRKDMMLADPIAASWNYS